MSPSDIISDADCRNYKKSIPTKNLNNQQQVRYRMIFSPVKLNSKKISDDYKSQMLSGTKAKIAQRPVYVSKSLL